MFDGSLPARSPASHFDDPQFNIHHSPDQTINTRSQGRHLGSNPSLARPSEKQTTRELIQDINLLLNLIGPADANINGAPQPHTLPNQQTAPNEQVGGGTDAGLLNALITSHPAPNQMSSASSTSGMINSFVPAQSGFAQATSTQLQLNSSAKSIVPATKTVLLTTPAPAPNAVEALSQVLGNSVPKSVAARMVNEILPSELRILNKGSQNGVATSGKGTPGQVTVRIVTEEPPEIDEILLREMLKKMRG
ncbi:hypothetical protein FSP39_014706 [Pinctada imbricata]|uniref:Uncharacterized protein n=1 Tax=Pinctada imbricata TaxID=66713 RepID=A0AA88YAG4_PINIB|nr:hypothetical protein FSP39_014706 [Pinctada imbricata]